MMEEEEEELEARAELAHAPNPHLGHGLFSITKHNVYVGFNDVAYSSLPIEDRCANNVLSYSPVYAVSTLPVLFTNLGGDVNVL